MRPSPFSTWPIFNLPLASKEASELSDQELLRRETSLFTGISSTPGAGTAQKVRRFLEQEFKRDPLPLPRSSNADPPVFTSNHAALLQQGCRFC